MRSTRTRSLLIRCRTSGCGYRTALLRHVRGVAGPGIRSVVGEVRAGHVPGSAGTGCVSLRAAAPSACAMRSATASGSAKSSKECTRS